MFSLWCVDFVYDWYETESFTRHPGMFCQHFHRYHWPKTTQGACGCHVLTRKGQHGTSISDSSESDAEIHQDVAFHDHLDIVMPPRKRFQDSITEQSGRVSPRIAFLLRRRAREHDMQLTIHKAGQGSRDQHLRVVNMPTVRSCGPELLDVYQSFFFSFSGCCRIPTSSLGYGRKAMRTLGMLTRYSTVSTTFCQQALYL